MFKEFDSALVCHGDFVVGSIHSVNYDFPHYYAKFTADTSNEDYRNLFAFLMDENANGDPPFSAELLDEENWWIKMPDGSRVDISLPAIDYDDGTTDWRTRP